MTHLVHDISPFTKYLAPYHRFAHYVAAQWSKGKPNLATLYTLSAHNIMCIVTPCDACDQILAKRHKHRKRVWGLALCANDMQMICFGTI